MAAVGYLPPVAMACALLLGSASRPLAQPALTIPDAALEPVGFNDLKGWALDDRAAAFRTFLASCRALGSKQGIGGKQGTGHTPPSAVTDALRNVCERATAAALMPVNR